MKPQTDLLDQIEEIKARLINIETILIESEKPRKEDLKAVKQALQEYRKGKTVPFNF